MYQKNTISFVLVFFLAFVCVSPVSATDLSFRDRSPMAGQQGFIVYEVNAANTTVLGFFNTTTNHISLAPNASYIFQFTTTNIDYLSKPSLIPSDFLKYVRGTYTDWLIIGFLLVLFAIAVSIGLR